MIFYLYAGNVTTKWDRSSDPSECRGGYQPPVASYRKGERQTGGRLPPLQPGSNLLRHCKERSDVAISCKGAKTRPYTGFTLTLKNLTTEVVRSICWHYLSSRAVARQVLSAQMCLTSVFGMGTGGPTSQSIPTSFDGC